jgi:hypothetical protein
MALIESRHLMILGDCSGQIKGGGMGGKTRGKLSNLMSQCFTKGMPELDEEINAATVTEDTLTGFQE